MQQRVRKQRRRQNAAEGIFVLIGGRGVNGCGMDTRTTASGCDRNILSSSGVKFCSAESTQHTMNELAHKCHEKAEYTCACILLLCMGCLALGVYFVTGNSGGEHRGINLHFQSLRSKEYGVAANMPTEGDIYSGAKEDVDGIYDLLKKDKDGEKENDNELYQCITAKQESGGGSRFTVDENANEAGSDTSTAQSN
eukprot:199444-Ditylum_brightwellii.AAC.1